MSVSIETNEVSGPASYTTGGFVVATGLATVSQFKLFVKTPGANLPHCQFEYSRSGGNVTVKIKRHMGDVTGATLGGVSGLPSGITAPAVSGSLYDANTTHTHGIDHDHASTTSAASANSGTGVFTGVGGINQTTHTHPFDVPAFTGTSGVGSSHTHTWNNIYDHTHVPSNTSTNPTLTEITNGTNLSGTTFFYRAIG